MWAAVIIALLLLGLAIMVQRQRNSRLEPSRAPQATLPVPRLTDVDVVFGSGNDPLTRTAEWSGASRVIRRPSSTGGMQDGRELTMPLIRWAQAQYEAHTEGSAVNASYNYAVEVLYAANTGGWFLVGGNNPDMWERYEPPANLNLPPMEEQPVAGTVYRGPGGAIRGSEI